MAWVHQRDEVDDCPSKLRGKRDGSESEHGGANDHEVADRPYNRGENVISHRIAKISRIDRSRFSPSQHGNSCEHSNEGQEYGSERVDVLDRIQRDAAQHTRGRVTAAVRHPGVCRLMHADGEQKHDQLKQNVNMLQGHAGMSSILTCGPASPNLCRRRGGALTRPAPAAARGFWLHNATGELSSPARTRASGPT